MPIYEYQCQACGKVNEVMQKFGDDAPAACDACAKGPLSKLLSKSGFILKGSGWYVTDFRGNSSKSATGDVTKTAADSKPADAGSPAATPSSDTKETKTETKTETKSTPGGCGTGCGHNH